MKKYKTKTTKYEYWKWLLLSKHTKKYNSDKNIVAVCDNLNRKMFRYDLSKNKKIRTRWEGVDYLLENELMSFLTIDELEKFYLSLPKNKQAHFWDYIYHSQNKNNIFKNK